MAISNPSKPFIVSGQIINVLRETVEVPESVILNFLTLNALASNDEEELLKQKREFLEYCGLKEVPDRSVKTYGVEKLTFTIESDNKKMEKLINVTMVPSDFNNTVRIVYKKHVFNTYPLSDYMDIMLKQDISQHVHVIFKVKWNTHKKITVIDIFEFGDIHVIVEQGRISKQASHEYIYWIYEGKKCPVDSSVKTINTSGAQTMEVLKHLKEVKE